MPNIGVILVAGGSGQRCGGALPKQFHMLRSIPVLARTINLFAGALPGAPIVVVLPANRIAFWHDLAARFDVAPHTVAEAGPQRFHSVLNGLAALPDQVELIAVHDGVRPLATPELIRRTAEAAAKHGTAIPVTEPVDSFRMTESVATGDDVPTGFTTSYPVDRQRLRIVQTPQVFLAEILRKAYRTAYDEAFTDDASVVEHDGVPVFLAEGERTNLKLTTQDDFTLAEAILSAREDTEQTDADRL